MFIYCKLAAGRWIAGDGPVSPAISRMAEAGVPDAIIMALAGHVSRSMLERYSHISLVGKRRAVEALEGIHSTRETGGVEIAVRAVPSVH